MARGAILIIFVATTIGDKKMNKLAVAIAGFSMLFSLSQACHAEKMLSGDEIKALITGKTVYVVVPNSSTNWRQYYAADGSSARDNGQTSTWQVEGDIHCNTAAKNNPCLPIRDNGNGTYDRMKSDGSPAVTWTKIIDGKEF